MRVRDKLYKELNDLNIDLPVLEQWDFNIIDAKSQIKVTKLETDVGAKCLQIRTASPDLVFHQFLVLEHLSHHGMKRIPRLIRTRFGEPYIKIKGSHYCISDWIHGRPINIKDQNDVVKSVRDLAELHLASKGFYLPGEKVGNLTKDNWGLNILGMAAKIAELKNQIKSPVFFKESIQNMAERAATAGKILSGRRYSQLKQRLERELSFCHGAYTREHLIMGRTENIYITGLAHWRRDIRLRDLAEFLSLVGSVNQWDHQLCEKLISNYNRISPLLPVELELLQGYLLFPFGYWEVLMDLSQEEAKPAKTKARLEAYLQLEEKKEKCLIDLF